MNPSIDKRIIHVNNVANVPLILIKGLKEIGYNSILYQPLLNRENNIKSKFKLIYFRIKDIRYLRRNVEKNDILHIHYGFYGILGILSGKKYYLHLHGSDVRKNLKSIILGSITKLCIKKAINVFYSTPDLYELINPIRPDSIFLPNPIDTELFKPIECLKSNNDGYLNIFIFARLDETKGADKIFKIVDYFSNKDIKIKFTALKWGSDYSKYEVKYRFVNYIDFIEYDKLPIELNTFDLIIGQLSYGVVGVSELQALACGIPTITYFNYNSIYSDEMPVLNIENEKEGIDIIIKIYNKKLKINSSYSVSWINNNHSYLRVAEKLIECYSK
ncbi:MAG: glycosyltransferase [Clostridium sulfidigenes]|uniref:Glycosyltransferase n=1 Tax=Clostridium sulfidigenes TaxID=318464 RepID=A0A927W7F8_9CLOT|nr:glycosyltransferase [Clostridium sulfidigenes]